MIDSVGAATAKLAYCNETSTKCNNFNTGKSSINIPLHFLTFDRIGICVFGIIFWVSSNFPSRYFTTTQ